ncbi:alpha/beta-hydrolase [Anaeromyces robustus]|uniref:Alpha/beta-hydrolase n=1 Tax=Anaeromyces robustus TaxID=1754192 RepID=A0A1Y1X204_9FUNG|nr:alpha/beta-hydrolase [Anaeromyces robustus]|eukprot:ORX79841.1 alpha/beta-hydrolase [Anaeromyces robustus]
MKFLTILLFVLNTIILCNAFKINDALSFISSSSSSSYVQELKDNKRDIENYLNVKHIERNIQYNEDRTLDVYYDQESTELKPVYIFLYGGAWHSGSKVKFTNFGSLLDNNGYVAVLPDYILFPYGGFEDMVDDVYHAIKWTFENIQKFGGDPNRVSISAYSAGSHLTALTLLKSLLNYSNKNIELEPFPEFEKVVLLNGPYDFDDYSVINKMIGQSNNSILEKLVQLIFKSPNVSPTDLLKPLSDNSLTSLGAKHFVFFYTSLDQQVKESSAINFMDQMKRVCPNVSIEYVYKEGYEHTTLTRGVRASSPEEENVYLSLLNIKF